MSNLSSLTLYAALASSSIGSVITMPTIWPTVGGSAASSKARKSAGISMAQQQRNSRKARNVKRHKAAARG